MIASSEQKHHVTAPEDKVSLGKKILYGSGSFADMTFQWTLVAFALAIFNMELGYSAVLIGTVLAITRLWDAITDPLMGAISDNARTRFGRRRPFIAVGSVLAGIFFIAIWFIPAGLSDTVFFTAFLVLSLLFYTSYTVFTVPLLAMGYEMSSDFHERTNMMNVRVFANSLNGVFMFSWFFALVYSDYWSGPNEGIRMVGLGFGLVMMILGLIPALTLKEKTKSYVKKQEHIPVIKSIKLTFSCKPFLFLVLAFFAAFFAYNTVATAYIYPLRYAVLGDDGGLFGKWYGLIEASHHVSTVLMLWPISVLSKRLGKRVICMVAPLFLILGSLANFFCYVPDMPELVLIPRFLVAIGIAGLFVLVLSMITDVVDYDEMQKGTRREGMFGAIFSWVLKFALAIALFINGFIVDGLGVNKDLGVNQPEGSMEAIVNLLSIVPIIGAVVAFYCIYRYTLTEDKMYGMRTELEKRRGVN